MRNPTTSSLLIACCVGSLLSTAWVGSAVAADARPIRHQGFLLDDAGRPVTGSRDLSFSIYDFATGENDALWTEAHPGVDVDRGLFSVLLGSSESFPPGLFSNYGTLWLETSVGGAALTPRVQLTAVALAVNAEALAGVPASGWQRLVGDGCTGGDAIAEISETGEVTCVSGPVGDPGPQGPIGPQGPAGELAAGSVTTSELADDAVTSDKLAEGAVTTSKIAPDFTLEVEQLSGLLGQETGYVLPDVADNTVELEIAGVGGSSLQVVVIAGPGSETEVIESYWGNGRIRHLPGLSHETMFVFEYSGPAEADLQALHEDYLLGPENRTLRSMSIIVRDLAQFEVFRWNLFEYGLISIGAGSEGRNRYTFRQTTTPDNWLRFEMAGGDFGNNQPDGGRAVSHNPATDKRVEIESVIFDVHPAVVVDEGAKTVTLEFDWVEGAGIFEWYKELVEGKHPLKSMSIIEDAEPGNNSSEISRRNYFEVWPKFYQNFTGFGLDVKMKARIVISFDWSEEG